MTRLELYIICKNGNLEAVKQLLKDMDDNQKEATLSFSVQFDQVEIAKLMIENGAKVNRTNDDGSWTYLHTSSRSGCVEMVKLLIDNGAIINYDKETDSKYFTPLHVACIEGKYEVAKILVEHGIDVNRIDKCNCTAIYTASDRGFLDIVKLLVANGAKIEEEIYKRSALYSACHSGHIDVVEFLLENGADIHAKNINGWTSLQISIYHNQLELTSLLFKNGATLQETEDDIHMLTYLNIGNLDMAKLLMENGADVNKTDEHGYTLLGYAVHSGHFDLTKLLLDSGADVNLPQNFDYTPIHLAVTEDNDNSYNIAKLLLERGADISRVDSRGYNILFGCVKRPDLLRLMLDYGADVLHTIENNTPISWAADRGNIEAVKVLIDNDSKLKINNPDMVSREIVELIHRSLSAWSFDSHQNVPRRNRTRIEVLIGLHSISWLSKIPKSLLYCVCRKIVSI
jgi:ankyrin repeat protein